MGVDGWYVIAACHLFFGNAKITLIPVYNWGGGRPTGRIWGGLSVILNVTHAAKALRHGGGGGKGAFMHPNGRHRAVCSALRPDFAGEGWREGRQLFICCFERLMEGCCWVWISVVDEPIMGRPMLQLFLLMMTDDGVFLLRILYRDSAQYHIDTLHVRNRLMAHEISVQALTAFGSRSAFQPQPSLTM